MAQIIDFSMIDRISAKKTATAEEPERRRPEQTEEQASFLQAGSLVLAPQPSAQAKPQPEHTQPQGAAPERKREAFTDHSGGRDYNKLYRIAHEYHKRHYPPVVEREYWRTHTPGEDDTPEAELKYWTDIAEDAGKTSAAAGNDELMMSLITAVIDELEREYKAIREEACRSALSASGGPCFPQAEENTTGAPEAAQKASQTG
jgi:hypothetical protein